MEDTITKLAEKLETLAPHVWAAAYRQAFWVQGVWSAIMSAFILIGGCIALKMVIATGKKNVVLTLLVFLGVFIGAINLVGAIEHILNPAWYAIELLKVQVK